MFGGNDIKTIQLTIDSDPGGDGELFYLMKAPAALTVLSAYMVSEQTQNAGTAVALTLQNWGTAGTAVASGGTIGSAGGTASASRLTARTPAAVTLTAAQQYVAKDTWLAVMYNEQGAGWIANDRFVFQVNYVLGKGA